MSVKEGQIKRPLVIAKGLFYVPKQYESEVLKLEWTCIRDEKTILSISLLKTGDDT